MFRLAKRATYTVVLAGALIAAAGGAVLAGQDSGVVHASPAAAAAGHTAKAGGGFGVGKMLGKHAGGRLLKVTQVNGTTILATNPQGKQVTVDTGSTTTYSKADASAALSDVQPGEMIAVRGSLDSSTNTIQATQIVIVLPQATGVVTKISTDGNTLTITDENALVRTITLNGQTVYKQAGQTAQQSMIAVGSLITVAGTETGGNITAQVVDVHVPRFEGTVSNLQSSQFTLTARDGTTYTVQTGSSTTYTQPGYGTATATAIKSGGQVLVEGTVGSDGTTVTALRVTVLPSFGGPRGAGPGPAGAPGTGASA